MLIRNTQDFVPAMKGSMCLLLAMTASYLLPIWIASAGLKDTLAQLWLMYVVLCISPIFRTFMRMGVYGWALVIALACTWMLLTTGVLTNVFGLVPASSANYWQIGFSIIYLVLSATASELFVRRYVWANFGNRHA